MNPGRLVLRRGQLIVNQGIRLGKTTQPGALQDRGRLRCSPITDLSVSHRSTLVALTETRWILSRTNGLTSKTAPATTRVRAPVPPAAAADLTEP
jgi:hypothetical protein